VEGVLLSVIQMPILTVWHIPAQRDSALVQEKNDSDQVNCIDE
jgi:hypothetical protein